MGSRETSVQAPLAKRRASNSPKTAGHPQHNEAIQHVITSPSLASPSDILRLQSLVGNRATAQFIQTKLAVGPAGDPYEQEADRVAAQVTSDKPSATQGTEDETWVQRDVAHDGQPKGTAGFDVDSETERYLLSQQGHGAALPDTLRPKMESKLGANFNAVRIHSDAHSADLNRALTSEAFTYGQDIYLGKGHTDLHTKQGKQLLAHELTHVVQQTGRASRRLQRWSMGAKGEGHEVLTRESLRQSGFTDQEIQQQFGGRDAFIAGSKWNDLPGGYGAATAIVGAGPGTSITYRSHNKDLQFLHGMAAAEQKASTTVEYMLAWAEFCYTIAQGNGGITPNTLLTNIPIPLIQNLFPDKDYHGKTVGWLFMEKDAKRLKAVAIGSMLHMIQDTFCAAHTQRARKKPGDSYGKIRTFQDYGQQDHGRHGKADEVVKVQGQTGLDDAASIQATVGAQDAVEVGTMVLARMRQGIPWKVVKSYLLGEVFALEGGSADKGATATRHFRKSLHKEFKKRLPYYATWSPPLTAVVNASATYDTLLEYQSAMGIQYEREEDAVHTTLEAIAAWRRSRWANDPSMMGEAKAKPAITFLAGKMQEDLTDIERDAQQHEEAHNEATQ